MTNKEFSRTREFELACEGLKIKPTKRQASKFRMKKGTLYKSTGGRIHDKRTD